MIVARTPFRISFAGGGTDLPYFYRRFGGCVLSMAIRRYFYLSMHPSFDRNGFLIKYSRTEKPASVHDIQHPIIREVFELYDIDGVDFSSAADIPSGTGLASSSAFTCGILRLCDAYTGKERSQLDIASLACSVEIEKLGEPIGKQDQYGCALPGLKLIEFHLDDTVTVSPILMDDATRTRLESSLLMVYCGGTRSASALLGEQRNRFMGSTQIAAEMSEMAKLARQLSQKIVTEPDCLGDFLHEGWERKKRLSSSVSNSVIDGLYKRARSAGARGGKLLGAGGAGFLLLHAPDNLNAVLEAFQTHKVELVSMDDSGTTIVHNDQV